jgi:hypothetical protein
MAKKREVNKSQKVRDYLKEHPGAGNKEVSETLTKQGVKVSPNYVATVKGKSKVVHKKRRQAVRKVVAKTGVGVPQMKAAFALLKECGSGAAAKEALAAAEELRAML